jgi:hypothetical protein
VAQTHFKIDFPNKKTSIMLKPLSFILIIIALSCTETSNEENERKYKNNFLKLAEFDCDGITSDYYVTATIDNMEYCKSVNDTIKNVIFLANYFTTSSPNSSDTILGTAFKTIKFGIFKDFDLEKTLKKQFFFISGEYSVNATIQEIAADVFVKGKKWPIRNSQSDKNSISCVYQFTDNRVHQNKYYEVNSRYGFSKNHFIIMDDVVIDTVENQIIYNVKCSFDADLFMSDTQYLEADNLWGEVRNGKMKARFVVPL